MKTLILRNADDSVRVLYRTDIVSGEYETGGYKFTVLAIEGLSDAEQASGINFNKLTYDIPTFKTFATANSLQLVITDDLTGVNTILIALP